MEAREKGEDFRVRQEDEYLEYLYVADEEREIEKGRKKMGERGQISTHGKERRHARCER